MKETTKQIEETINTIMENVEISDEKAKNIPKITTTPLTPKLEHDCSNVKLGQFLAIGQPKKIMITGFPKSGAMWFKSVIDDILPYYFWLEEVVSTQRQIN